MKKTLIRLLGGACIAAMISIAVYRLAAWSDRSSQSSPVQTQSSGSSIALGALNSSDRETARKRGVYGNGDDLTNSPDGRFQADGQFLTVPNREGFRLRPFAVSMRSDDFAWTAEDGKTDEAMRDLSHTEEEEDRLKTDNQWVNKRQLVYCSDYIESLGKEVATQGAALKTAKLPGFDGKEYEVEIVRAESPQGTNEWNISGTLKDRPDTMVAMSSVHGYTSLVIVSPEIYIEGDAREPGEVVLNQIDRVARQAAQPQGPVETVSPFDVGSPSSP
ncbi:hypothetical protein JIN85_06630 [Luteolibacter pohnpeiensis]|uniref:Uncharacterized protein n=1 Tax=Luteolibacter pohnpeiensis TaxID=454153 RepID=A0A934VU24_9BACT|nr:hypothetical protein [Luteolibacter pohnpeiensis]MBK1882082.1 hypothetical protein [Luteolibacter pohnpeiensis]